MDREIILERRAGGIIERRVGDRGTDAQQQPGRVGSPPPRWSAEMERWSAGDEQRVRSADRHRHSDGYGDRWDAERYRDGGRGPGRTSEVLAWGRSRSPDRYRHGDPVRGYGESARDPGRSWEGRGGQQGAERDGDWNSCPRGAGGSGVPARGGSIGGHGGKSGPGRQRSAGSAHHININKRITGSSDMRELCSLVETTLAEFNHVNVVTAFRKILLTRCDGVSRVMAEQALQSL